MGRIPDATIHEIRDRADIVGLIGRHVELKQAGRNWKGLCPFHDEKSPSFNVSPDRGIFHCFGCQTGGDAIEFLIRYENLTFPEAVRTLAQDLGIVIPESDDGGQRGETEAIHAALAAAQDHYAATLASPEGEPGRAYLEARGIDAATIERFGLGFAADAWDGVQRALEARRIPARVAEAAGLLLERKGGGGHYDRLRGRVTFPIFDVRGRVIAFGGRALGKDQEPKYLNTPESSVYHKRQAFYGFPQALEPIRRRERAVICEGYFDAIALARADVGEAIATCGTALTADHAKNLRRRTKSVHLLFDGDAAGQKAMERGLAVLLPEGLRVRAIALPGGQDPDDFLNAHGAEALRALVDKAPDALEVAMRRAMAAGCSTPTEKTDVVQHVATLLAAIPNPVERSEYTRRLAVATSTDLAAVEAVVRTAVRGEGRRADAPAVAVARPRTAGPEDRHLRQLALIVSRHPALASEPVRERMRDILPAGSWKDLTFKLIEAAEQGCVGGDGAIDPYAAGERLDEQDRALLHDITVDDALLDSETPVREVFEHILSRYQVKDLEAKEKELTRRMQDPEADLQTLLREKQALLERKRARAGIALNPAT